MAKQGAAHVFSKVNVSGFAGQTVGHNHNTCPCSTKTATDKMQTNRQGHVPTPHFLWALKFVFYVIFMCLLISFQPFKNLKTLVSWQAIQKQGAGHI